jgi:endonuclease/exonuclease/phosphatase family metal-dependent hydrolase
LLHDRNKKKAIPQAIFGDFNASPIWTVYKTMAANFVDCVVAANISGEDIKGTWPYIPQLGIRGIIRIDHCFLWKLSANRVQTVEMPGSDHLGLLVDLDISELPETVS